MYINEVISYCGAWNVLKENHTNLLEDLGKVFENLNFHFKKSYLENNSGISLNNQINDFLEQELLSLNWEHKKNFLSSSNDSIVQVQLGYRKESCFVKILHSNLSAELHLMSWIYNDIELANKNINIKVPILVILDFPIQNLIGDTSNNLNKKIEYRGLKSIRRKLEEVSPLKFEYPFLILGMRLEKNEIRVAEIEKFDLNKNNQNIKIERSIEFKPEHYQAGLGILSYFGTVLRDKYPDQNATVKIEQHELTVRMIIETEDGNTETLEKALHEYELVLKGQKSAEEFYLSPIKALELKNQLNIFKFQVDSQKEIITLQRGQILSLEDIVDKALAPITHPPVTIINQLNNTQSVNINHQTALNQTYDDLDKLIDLVDKDSLKKRLERALTAIDVAQNLAEPEEVKNSGGMKQLAKILNEANEVGTEVNDLVEQGGKAFELMKNLGRKYNSVAEWCGLPVIPSIFVKE